MLSLCMATCGSSLPARPDARSSSTATSSPLASRASTTWEPMKPAPPVTSTRIPEDLMARVSAHVDDAAGRGERDRAAEGRKLPCLRQRPLLVVPRHQVGEDELARPGPGSVL